VNELQDRIISDEDDQPHFVIRFSI
jgi:hypothetical protein